MAMEWILSRSVHQQQHGNENQFLGAVHSLFGAIVESTFAAPRSRQKTTAVYMLSVTPVVQIEGNEG